MNIPDSCVIAQLLCVSLVIKEFKKIQNTCRLTRKRQISTLLSQKMEHANLLTVEQIVLNPALATQRFNLIKATGSEEILFRPLSHDDVLALQEFFECLSETTRLFATYPSYDLQCAQQFCFEINRYDKLRMVATIPNGKIIAIFEFNLSLVEFDINRYRKYGVELNDDSDIQLAPCIMDEYQNQHLGTELLHLMIDLAKRLNKKRMILWAGVMTHNKQAIRFYEKNNFKVFQEKFVAEDGYECYDGILQLS
jgi:RimJ/RimL family protein N-acetyltransferase